MAAATGFVAFAAASLFLRPQLSFGKRRHDANNENWRDDVGRRAESESQHRCDTDDGQNGKRKAFVGHQTLQVLKKRGAVVHCAAYWNSFMALTSVWATPASSGMPAKLQARVASAWFVEFRCVA
jgi:hypothetical protein